MYLASRFIEDRQNIVNWFDAIGLSLFSVQGYMIADSVLQNPEVSIIMGVITGCGGGLLRDICMNRQPFIFRGEIYASASIVGLAVFSFYPNIILAFLIIFLLRALSIRFHVALK